MAEQLTTSLLMNLGLVGSSQRFLPEFLLQMQSDVAEAGGVLELGLCLFLPPDAWLPPGTSKSFQRGLPLPRLPIPPCGCHLSGPVLGGDSSKTADGFECGFPAFNVPLAKFQAGWALAYPSALRPKTFPDLLAVDHLSS